MFRHDTTYMVYLTDFSLAIPVMIKILYEMIKTDLKFS